MFCVIESFIFNPLTKEKYKTSEKGFSRKRKLPFELLLLSLINIPKRTLAIELHAFYDYIKGKLNKVVDGITASAFTQGRQKLSPEVFVGINQELIREYYNINHKDVYMGILVHRSFPNEEVNGVAITKNLYRPDSYGFVINVQIGNQSVVKPKKGIISDQFICYPNNRDNIYNNKNTIDIITQSNINENKLVMTDEEIQNLANQHEVIKKYFINLTFTSKSYLEFGLDIEFKLDNTDRELYIKQVRLYND